MAITIYGIGFVIICVFSSLELIIRCNGELLSQQSFSKDFLFGAATASYQVEGAWNLSGKGENIWDKFTHEHPDKIDNGDNGDVACDSYHKYKEDVQLAANLKLHFYRFSISWSRILPTGYPNKINPDGIRYYNALIDELLAHGIEPIITLYHWDLPATLQVVGGWSSCYAVDSFVDFAEIAFENFGDRVKKWITFNEPREFCELGYGQGGFAPGLNASGIGDYICTRVVLQAHARVYHMYQSLFKQEQKGIIGICMVMHWMEPNTTSKADSDAADRLFEFKMGLFANPIYGYGDYPTIVKRFVDERSRQQGFRRSRLLPLSASDVRYLKGSADFLGLNYYTCNMVADGPEEDLSVVSMDSDAKANYWLNDKWPTSEVLTWFKVVPWGIRKLLRKVKEKYGDVPIYIAENGYPDGGQLNDINRTNYLLTHLSYILDAIHIDKANVKAYTYWSLLDNFGWESGYKTHYGLYHVDFSSPNRTRRAKRSVSVYRNIIESRKLPQHTITSEHGKREATLYCFYQRSSSFIHPSLVAVRNGSLNINDIRN